MTKSLKRYYKATTICIDKNSQRCNDAKRCTYCNGFNKLYRLKVSTKPTVTVASVGATDVEERQREKEVNEYEELQVTQKQRFHDEHMKMMAQSIKAIKKLY